MNVRRIIFGPWPTTRFFRLHTYGFVALFLGFGVALIGDALGSLALLFVGVVVMIPALAFMFYLQFTKRHDRLDGT